MNEVQVNYKYEIIHFFNVNFIDFVVVNCEYNSYKSEWEISLINKKHRYGKCYMFKSIDDLFKNPEFKMRLRGQKLNQLGISE